MVNRLHELYYNNKMKGTPTPTGCFTKRKLAIVGISIAVLVLVGYVLRERYFYRADVLIAIQTNVKHARKVVTNKIGSNGGILGLLRFGGKNNVGETDEVKVETVNVWDAWMIKQTTMTSIGDIYDHCGKRHTSRHTTSKQRLSNIHNVQITLYER